MILTLAKHPDSAAAYAALKKLRWRPTTKKCWAQVVEPVGVAVFVDEDSFVDVGVPPGMQGRCRELVQGTGFEGVDLDLDTPLSPPRVGHGGFLL
ncbi:hypothetical protein [Saccharopolyspora hattusasensis]|uniref:hypothetical protein n=1 Tax=Saccharopolyspora hattusasensis TaxID=1128679 RepID=UPI003D985EFF